MVCACVTTEVFFCGALVPALPPLPSGRRSKSLIAHNSSSSSFGAWVCFVVGNARGVPLHVLYPPSIFGPEMASHLSPSCIDRPLCFLRIHHATILHGNKTSTLYGTGSAYYCARTILTGTGYQIFHGTGSVFCCLGAGPERRVDPGVRLGGLGARCLWRARPQH